MTEQATIATAETQTTRAADALVPRAPVGAHLVGSVPLGSVEEVFRRTAGVARRPPAPAARRRARPRADWILWQYPVFSALPQFEVGPPGADTYRTLPKLRLRDGERAEDIVLDNLGFADAAIASYRVFAKLKRDGVIPAHVRFQVSLPTPLAPVSAFIDPEHQAQVEPVYEARVLRELDGSSPPCRTTSSRCSGTRGWSSRSSRASAPPGFRATAPACSSASCASAAACPPTSSSAFTSATATTTTGTSSCPTTRASSSRSPTRSRPRCTAR